MGEITLKLSALNANIGDTVKAYITAAPGRECGIRLRCRENEAEIYRGTDREVAVPIKSETVGPWLYDNVITATMFVDCYYPGGEMVSQRLNVSIPESIGAPKLTTTVSIAESLPPPFDGIALSGLTKIKVDVKTELYYGADLLFREIGYAGKLASKLPALFEADASAGPISVRVVDGRTYETRQQMDNIAVSYYAPIIKRRFGKPTLVYRCSSSGEEDPVSEKVAVEAEIDVCEVEVGGVNKNTWTFMYRYKTPSTSYSSWTSLPASGNMVSAILPMQFSVDDPWSFELKVTDAVGQENTTGVQIATAGTPLHLGKDGKSIALGRKCSYRYSTPAVEIGWRMHLYKGIQPKMVFETSWSGDGAWLPGQPLNSNGRKIKMENVNDATVFVAAVLNEADDHNTVDGEALVPLFRRSAGAFGTSATTVYLYGSALSYSPYRGWEKFVIRVTGDDYVLGEPQSDMTPFKIGSLYILF